MYSKKYILAVLTQIVIKYNLTGVNRKYQVSIFYCFFMNYIVNFLKYLIFMETEKNVMILSQTM